MKHEIYNALKSRISVVPFTEEDKKYYEEQGWSIDLTATHYLLRLEDLGEDYFNYAHSMRTKNLWNVAQRFWRLLGNEDLENALLNC